LLGNAAAGTELVNPKLGDAEAVDARWRGVVDVVDSLLERADMCLDEFHGVIRRGNAEREQQVCYVLSVPGNMSRCEKVANMVFCSRLLPVQLREYPKYPETSILRNHNDPLNMFRQMTKKTLSNLS
jgi:hypothetical protein